MKNERLYKMIQDRGMTRYELTKRMGVSSSSLDRYFNGHATVKKMGLETAVKMADVLGVSPVDILNTEKDSQN